MGVQELRLSYLVIYLTKHWKPSIRMTLDRVNKSLKQTIGSKMIILNLKFSLPIKTISVHLGIYKVTHLQSPKWKQILINLTHT
jgi:hypothetical protein